VDLLVPTDAAGHATQAGPYVRSRQAAAGDGIIGGTSAGYWVQLWSTGEVKVFRLNPVKTVAASRPRNDFDPTIYHQLEVNIEGERLQAAVDGRRVDLFQDETQQWTQVVPVPSSWEGPPPTGYNQGRAGIFFGAQQHRGQIGGQRADNLVIATPRELPARDASNPN
jgi:hypothetical protein